MLHHGQKFDVRESHLLDVGNQAVAQFAIRQPAIAFFGDALPRAEMDFIKRDRRVEPVPLGALGHPLRVIPRKAIEVGHHRPGLWPLLPAESVRVSLQRQRRPFVRENLVLVNHSFRYAGNEQLPDSRRSARAQRMHAAVPIIKVTDDADAPGVRRPHCKMHAAHALDGLQVRAELLVAVVVRAFAEQMKIEIAQQGRKGIGIGDRPFRAGGRPRTCA